MIAKTVLPSGVRLVTETIDSVHSVSIGVWLKTGARYERSNENGLAHFLEHMLFKGTRKYSALEIARAIDSVGGVINAFTAKEHTCFYVKVLRQHLALAVDLLTDIFFNSLFAPEEIDKERNVVIQEINMVKDTPDDYIQDLFNQSFFSGHVLQSNILGDCESVGNFSHDDLVGFVKREYFSPQNVIISATGNVEHQVLLDSIGKAFDRLSGSSPAATLADFTPQRKVSFDFRELEQVHVCLGTRGVSQSDPDRYGLYLLNAVLGGSMSSRLFQEIRENRGLAYTIYSFMVSFIETGVFGIYMGVVNDTLEESLDVTLGELRRMRDVPLSGEELVHAKEQLKGNMLLSLESTDSRMSRLARCELYYDQFVPIEEVLESIDAVTPEDVQRLAGALFQDDQFTYTFLGPVKETDVAQELLLLK
ncbi:MAG: insulinase family protein [Deltaproteobacteria bacterium]|nr:insulinase family protein [Deltaproteobacteria bacterium]